MGKQIFPPVEANTSEGDNQEPVGLSNPFLRFTSRSPNYSYGRSPSFQFPNTNLIVRNIGSSFLPPIIRNKYPVISTSISGLINHDFRVNSPLPKLSMKSRGSSRLFTFGRQEAPGLEIRGEKVRMSSYINQKTSYAGIHLPSWRGQIAFVTNLGNNLSHDVSAIELNPF